MTSANRFILALLVLGALGACSTTTTTFESQTVTQDRANARIYFLRQKSIHGLGVSPTIKIDGQTVGSVANGSYFFVDRPAGQHTIRAEPPIPLEYFEADIDVAAGGTYYFEVGPFSSPTRGVLLPVLAGNKGEPIKGRGIHGPWVFKSLDTATGANEIAKLKAN
jgi:hypothetical protein